MPNKSSPHGGFVCEGSISTGTLRTQDLLRSFASELERVLPFNGARLVSEARSSADVLDAEPDGQVAQMTADDILQELIENLGEIAGRESMTFGAHESDGADFGYWKAEDES